MGIKRKIIMIVLVLIALIVLIPYILMIPDPMRRPHSMANNYILRLTPIGMCMEEVIDTLEGHRNWNIRINYERGFTHPQPPIDRPNPEQWLYIVGDKSITAIVGLGYWPAPIPVPILPWLFRTSVSIFWGFDEDGKLIEVFLRQSHGG